MHVGLSSYFVGTQSFATKDGKLALIVFRSNHEGWRTAIAGTRGFVNALEGTMFSEMALSIFATPTPTPAADVAGKFSTDVAGVLSNVTETLFGITDAASANVAVPKLKDASSQLNTLKALWTRVPDAAKPAIETALSTAISNAEKLVRKVAAMGTRSP